MRETDFLNGFGECQIQRQEEENKCFCYYVCPTLAKECECSENCQVGYCGEGFEYDPDLKLCLMETPALPFFEAHQKCWDMGAQMAMPWTPEDAKLKVLKECVPGQFYVHSDAREQIPGPIIVV